MKAAIVLVFMCSSYAFADEGGITSTAKPHRPGNAKFIFPGEFEICRYIFFTIFNWENWECLLNLIILSSEKLWSFIFVFSSLSYDHQFDFFCLRDEMVWQREQGKILWRSRRGWRYRQLLSGPWQSTGRDKARTNDEQHHKYSRLHNVSIEIIAWSENRNETIRILVKFVFVLEL